jgi:hypothetical protein
MAYLIGKTQPNMRPGPIKKATKAKLSSLFAWHRMSRRRTLELRLTQQGQHTLWQLVGLGHHRRTSLLQDL